jgi:hypothetical protein
MECHPRNQKKERVVIWDMKDVQRMVDGLFRIRSRRIIVYATFEHSSRSHRYSVRWKRYVHVNDARRLLDGLDSRGHAEVGSWGECCTLPLVLRNRRQPTTRHHLGESDMYADENLLVFVGLDFDRCRLVLFGFLILGLFVAGRLERLLPSLFEE